MNNFPLVTMVRWIHGTQFHDIRNQFSNMFYLFHLNYKAISLYNQPTSHEVKLEPK